MILQGQLLTPGASNRFVFQPDGSLLIRQVGPQNIGEYTCRVSSLAGTEEQTATLSIVEKPGMPLNVDARLINDSMPAKVQLTWLEGFDGNSPIINYLAQA